MDAWLLIAESVRGGVVQSRSYDVYTDRNEAGVAFQDAVKWVNSFPGTEGWDGYSDWSRDECYSELHADQDIDDATSDPNHIVARLSKINID